MNDLLTDGKYGEVILRCDKAIEEKQPIPLVYCLRGFAFLELGYYQEAINDLNKGIELHPELTGLYIYRGDAYFGLCNYKKAIEDYQRAIADKYEPPEECYLNLAYAKGQIGDHDSAIDYYTKYIEYDPNDPQTYNNRGCAYIAMKQTSKAIADFKKAISLDPQHFPARHNLEIFGASKDVFKILLRNLNKSANCHDQYVLLSK